MLAYLVDTNIVSDHFNGIKAATRFLDAYMGAIALSMVTFGETLLGCKKPQELKDKAEFLDRFAKVESDFADVQAMGQIEVRAEGKPTGRKLKFADALQVTTAMRHGLTLVTRDKDFENIVGLNVLTPYTVGPRLAQNGAVTPTATAQTP